MSVKCAFCGNQVDEPYRQDKKNYHKECYEQKLQRDELCQYICNMFALKAPGPRIYTQIKKYIDDGYTYVGILNALRYFYEIKKGSKEKANGGIGIVSYVYKDANNYFSYKDEQKTRIAESITKQFNKEEQVMKIKKVEQEKKKPLYDLDNI